MNPHIAANPNSIESMIRVNQAGEYGAKRIYQGQLATLKNPAARQQVQHMMDQERVHLDYFNTEMNQRQVRPTLLHPIWHIGGFALGAVTALMGKEAAMACTVAVETVIDEHYREQLAQLATQEGEAELKASITRFREEELEHRDTGLAEGAENAPAYPLLSAFIRGVTRTAITLSTRI
jgi:ubiquinone biosynthesis monooxygenase Coq7